VKLGSEIEEKDALIITKDKEIDDLKAQLLAKLMVEEVEVYSFGILIS
jgi:hypothetical protein